MVASIYAAQQPSMRGGAELPDPVLIVDFENNEFFWDGETKTLADLTDNGDGSYDLAYGSWFNGQVTAVVDFENVDGATPSGTYFSWISGSSRFEFTATAQVGNAAWASRNYISPAGAFFASVTQYPGQSATVRLRRRQRAVCSVASNTIPIVQSDNWPNRTPGSAVGVLPAPTKMTFGRRAFGDTGALVNASLKRVVLYSEVLSDFLIDQIGMGSNPIHLLGDSFLNEQGLKGELDLLLSGYTPVSQDGVGGSSITEQAGRYALNEADGLDISKWKKSTLVIMDGGFEGTSAEAITAINSILSKMPHDRWLYVEPAPQIAIGDTGRDEWDAKVADMQAFCGTHYVPTLDEAYAESDGSAEDISQVAKGLWPLSLTTAIDNFHPNAAGQAFLAAQIKAGLTSHSWI